MRVLGRYQLQKVLGVGNYGTVYQAHDPAFDSSVAIKVLAENHSQNDDLRRRFFQEARLLRQVESNHLITVYDIDEIDGQPYFVMELLAGGTLEPYIIGEKNSGPELLRTVAEGLVKGLGALHKTGIVHRDIKPSNLLFRDTANGEILIGDLGLAYDSSGTALTQGAGTRGYMAPEQQHPGNTVDPRADIFAATATLVALLTGSADIDDIDKTGLPKELRQVAKKGMADKPERRFATIEEWGDSLLAALPNEHSERPVTQTSRWPKKGVAAIGAVAVLVAVTGVAVVSLNSPAVTRAAEGPQIIGSETAVLGDITELEAVIHQDATDFFWTDWNGQRFSTPKFDVIIEGEGEAVVTLTNVVDGQNQTVQHTIIAQGTE